MRDRSLGVWVREMNSGEEEEEERERKDERSRAGMGVLGERRRIVYWVGEKER